jgi:hypothetical protein
MKREDFFGRILLTTLEIQKALNDEDEIRELILKYFYSAYKKSRSVTRGIKRRKIKQDLKNLGLREHEIASNLYYLVQTSYVAEIRKTFPLQKGGKTISAEDISYKITALGINHFEGPSIFQRNSKKLNGIKVERIQGVVVIGNDNVVYNKHSNLYRSLDLLGEEIRLSDKVSDKQKLSYQAEIDTIKSQLSKPAPDRSIIRRAWNALKGVATVGGVITTLEKVRELIQPLLA